MWDVILVGARCAGASTALLLARRGLRVLVVDQARFPSDALSTHFLWPRGMSYLNRWGLLPAVAAHAPLATEISFARDGIRFQAATPLQTVKDRLSATHGDGRGAVSSYASIRRKVLDSLLLEAAIAAGAEFRSEITVETMLMERGQAIGIGGRGPGGRKIEERARLVIGADGRRSRVASLVGAKIFDERSEATFAYWSYFSGLPPDQAIMEKRGRLAVVLAPTCFSASLCLLFGPKEWFPLFRKKHETNYYRAISFINPELGDRLRSEGRREERFYGIADQRAFKRQCAGPGWILAGDAACIKDQCTAIGMTHAFRDAELAAEAIVTGDLAGYAARREADLGAYYEFVCRSAAMARATEEDLRLMSALAADRRCADRFAAMYGDSLPVDEFTAARPRLLQVGPPAAFRPGPDGAAVFAA